jgi:hypothetical protein
MPAPEPATIVALPDWLEGRPDWLLANVERYAAALAGLDDPNTPAGEDGRTRADRVLTFAGLVVEILNAPPSPPEPPKARLIHPDRIATVRFGALDRNARRRLRRWLARQPVGPSHPIIRYRVGRYAEDRGWDLLDVA